MKLVEILARELEVWPEVTEIVGQAADGSLHLHECGSFHSNGHTHHRFTIADDWCHVHVTRPQWQAERDRMKVMEKIEQGVKQFENDADAFKRNLGAMAFTAEPTYEQQLWDRGAQSTLASMLGAIGGADFFIDDACTQKAVSSADFASCAADHADAFMAERAKRVGK